MLIQIEIDTSMPKQNRNRFSVMYLQQDGKKSSARMGYQEEL